MWLDFLKKYFATNRANVQKDTPLIIPNTYERQQARSRLITNMPKTYSPRHISRQNTNPKIARMIITNVRNAQILAKPSARNLRYNMVNETVKVWTGYDSLSEILEPDTVLPQAKLDELFLHFRTDIINMATLFKAKGKKITRDEFNKTLLGSTKYNDRNFIAAVLNYALINNKTFFLPKIINGDKPDISKMQDTLENKIKFIKNIDDTFIIKKAQDYTQTFINNHYAIEHISNLYMAALSYKKLSQMNFFRQRQADRLATELNVTPDYLKKLSGQIEKFKKFQYKLEPKK